MEQLTDEDILDLDHEDSTNSSSVYGAATKMRLCQIFIRQCRLMPIMGNIMCLVRDEEQTVLSDPLSRKVACLDSHAKVAALRQQLIGCFHLSSSILIDAPSGEQPHFATSLFSNITLMYYQ